MSRFKPRVPKDGTHTKKNEPKKGKATCLICMHDGNHAMNCPVIRDATKAIRRERRNET